ncbi:MAG: Zn-dependent exopeptidase M28 [Acidobacteria bacterium]|nr:Zn-dependent exopeptidase M28 [Acidobacteriota bacterium]
MRRLGLGLLLALLVSGSALSAGRQADDRVSGERAMGHVRRLVKLGGRPPGSDAHRRTQRYIAEQLHWVGLDVDEVDFVARTPRGSLAMKNIIGLIPGRSDDIIVLAGHYDTLATDGFVGANDGGSSVALLLELARVLRQRENPLTVWVVFFDGEEAAERFGPGDGLHGSRYQAFAWQRDGVLERVRAVIVVDMIGDKDLTLRRETNSTAWLTDLVWAVAREKGYGTHFLDEEIAVLDDHVAFAQAGVPAIDLIDFDYGPGNRYWHTSADKPDKLHPRSFEIVGEVILETVKRLTPPATR